jgi:hypothetical protein
MVRPEVPNYLHLAVPLVVVKPSVAHVEDGMRQADAGEFASEAEVRGALARWRR